MTRGESAASGADANAKARTNVTRREGNDNMLGRGMIRVSRAVKVGRARAARALHGTAAMAADERGDVPGWVLITLMTAGLVIIIWGLAGPALSGVFEQAIERVTSF